jgi:hypothetical protein
LRRRKGQIEAAMQRSIDVLARHQTDESMIRNEAAEKTTLNQESTARLNLC